MNLALAPNHNADIARGDIIRPAGLDDVDGIYQLLNKFTGSGILLPRSRNNLYNNLREFVVVELAGEIIGCAALQIFTRQLGEVRSLAVAEEYAGGGLGKKLVQQIELSAKQIGLTKLMALTYEVKFFNQLGFRVVDMAELPEKVWGVCINCPKFRHCDEIAMLKNI